MTKRRGVFQNSKRMEIKQNLACYLFPWIEGWGPVPNIEKLSTADNFEIIQQDNEGLWVLIKQGNPIKVARIRVSQNS